MFVGPHKTSKESSKFKKYLIKIAKNILKQKRRPRVL